jgi:hypothetical protein
LGQYGFQGQAFARLGFGRFGIFVCVDVIMHGIRAIGWIGDRDARIRKEAKAGQA